MGYAAPNSFQRSTKTKINKQSPIKYTNICTGGIAEERKEQKKIFEDTWPKNSQIDEIYEPTHPRSSMNYKENKPKEIHTKTWLNYQKKEKES